MGVDREQAEGLSSPGRGPIVGRGAELARLRAALDAAEHGEGALVLLAGEVGVGKSRLLQELAREARERRYVTVGGAARETGGAPSLWPWTQVARSILRQLGQDSGSLTERQTRALAQIAGHDEQAQPLAPDELFNGFTSALYAIASSHPVLLSLDDVHAADISTLRLLALVADVVRDARLLVVTAHDDPRDAAIRRLLDDLARVGIYIRLERLDDAAAAELVEVVAKDALAPELAATIVRAAEGNPLFIEEAVRLALKEQTLHRPDFSTGFRVPDGVRGLMRARVEDLPVATAELLGAAAVIGRDFEAPLLARSVGGEVTDVVALLAEAVRAQALVETGALGQFRFSHVLLRETLYEDLGAAERMRLHRKVAEAIEASAPDAVDTRTPELAHHWFKAAQAGDVQRAVDLSCRAGEAAASAGAVEEAARLYQRALTLAEVAGVDVARRRRIQEHLDALSSSGREVAIADEEPGMRFVLTGEFWTISYGGTTCQLNDTKGMRQIAYLLSNPGREVHAMELAALAMSGPRAAPEDRAGLPVAGDAGPLIDAAARAAYKRRLEELRADLEDAQDIQDDDTAERIEAEIDALVAQLRAAAGLGGRVRRSGSDAERARISVTRTIKDALKRVAQAHPSLAQHLDATLRTGTFCSYTPDPRLPARWET